jgi:hypothetical protein
MGEVFQVKIQMCCRQMKLSTTFFLALMSASCKSRSFHTASVSSEYSSAVAFCGEPLSFVAREKSLTLRVEGRAYRDLLVKFPWISAESGRNVQIFFSEGAAEAPLLKGWKRSQRLCVTAFSAPEKVGFVAKTSTVRQALPQEIEVAAEGVVVYSAGLYVLAARSSAGLFPVVLLGRNQVQFAERLKTLVNKKVILRGRPFLVADTLALLADSHSLYVVPADESRGASQGLSLANMEPLDPVEVGRSFADDFLKESKYESEKQKYVPKHRIQELSDHIVKLDERLLESKFKALEHEAENPGQERHPDTIWREEMTQAELDRCCELLLEAQERPKFWQLRRGGANARMYTMDGQKDFAELRQALGTAGPLDDLELDDL